MATAAFSKIVVDRQKASSLSYVPCTLSYELCPLSNAKKKKIERIT